MAGPGASPHELIAHAFSPTVAVLASASANLIAAKNNLNFVELLQPFSKLAGEGHVRDPSGQQCTIKNLKLNICDVNARPPQPTLARKFLNESVGNIYNDKTAPITIGRFRLDIPAATPWFEAWRETFFNVQFPSDHEFTKHFVACLLVVSTVESDPIETMKHMSQQLSQMQNVTPPKLPKWFNNNVLRCYVLLHDALEGNLEKAKRYVESLKQTYGAGNCFFLSINSRNPNEGNDCVLPDPWSKFLIRRIENSDGGSDKESAPRTPADMSSVSGMPVNIGSIENKRDVNVASAEIPNVMCDSASEISEGGVVTVQIHPLTPSEETDASAPFDSSNSLQNDMMSTSVESEANVMNPNVWDSSNGGNAGIVHGASLSTQDIENIRIFVQDFAFKALLPYFERQIFQLQDVVSNKKGVSRSLFIATKRWFGTNKTGANVPVNSVIYTGDCPELQLRRLGDIWFMLGQWSLAFQVYHTAKREYFSDNAWLYYAGALEMAALSAFMANESSRKTFDYMEESIMRYSNNCRMPQYAVRATLLSILCLNNRGLYSEAAKQLIRMTSEDCDLRSAVLLEQAALCFLAGPTRKTQPRKYAFHLVLAGHRYSKAGQRKHSLRCYKQAYQVYQGGGWRLATDHIECSMGRLAGQVRSWDASAAALSSLLAPRSLQPPAQQAAFLREYLHILQQWITQEPNQTSLLQLPVPLLDSNMTAVLCGGTVPVVSPGKVSASGTPLIALPVVNKLWASLENMLMHKAKGGPVMIFKPTLSLFCKTSDNSFNPIVPQGESVDVLVHLSNPLQIDMVVVDVQLLWQFKPQTSSNAEKSENDVFSNESCIITNSEYDKSIVTTQKVPLLLLQNEKTTPVTISLTPLHPGELTIIGVSFRLCNPVPPGEEATPNGVSILGKQIFEIKGPKLKSAKDNPGELQYGIDKRLNILVVPPAPCLQVTFTEIHEQLLCGELQRINVELKNIGRVALKNLYVGLSHPQYISVLVDNNNTAPFNALFESKYFKPPASQDERQQQQEKEKRTRDTHCIKILDTLNAGQSYITTFWLRAPDQSGNHKLHALFYYENSQPNVLPKHRLLRHTWNVTLKDSVHFSGLPRRTLKPEPDKSIYREALNLAIEIKNVNQVHHGILTTLEVQQVSLISQSWLLNNLVPINDDMKTLNSGETLHLIIRAKRAETESKDCELLHSDILINSENLTSIKEKPYSGFVTNFVSPYDDNILNNDSSSTSNNLDGECIDSVLVVRWKAYITENGGAERIAIGQHHINLDKLNVKTSSHANAESSKSTESASIKLFGGEIASNVGNSVVEWNSSPLDERLVTFTLEHQFEIRHDFKSRRVCLVPVKLHLVNCSDRMLVAIVNTSLKSFASKCPGIGWVGLGGNESGGVQLAMMAFESKALPLQIACTSPGTYSLGNIIRVSCKINRGETYTNPILQGHVASSTLIVIQNS